MWPQHALPSTPSCLFAATCTAAVRASSWRSNAPVVIRQEEDRAALARGAQQAQRGVARQRQQVVAAEKGRHSGHGRQWWVWRSLMGCRGEHRQTYWPRVAHAPQACHRHGPRPLKLRLRLALRRLPVVDAKLLSQTLEDTRGVVLPLKWRRLCPCRRAAGRHGGAAGGRLWAGDPLPERQWLPVRMQHRRPSLCALASTWREVLGRLFAKVPLAQRRTSRCSLHGRSPPAGGAPWGRPRMACAANLLRMQRPRSAPPHVRLTAHAVHASNPVQTTAAAHQAGLRDAERDAQLQLAHEDVAARRTGRPQ